MDMSAPSMVLMTMRGGCVSLWMDGNMHRLITSLSLAGCLGLLAGGCATVSPEGCIDCTPSQMHLHHEYTPWIDDHLTRHTAKKCACRHLAAYSSTCNQPVTKDFRRGFEQAFVDVAMGAPQAVPAVAPSRYWQAYYRSGAGRPLVEEWFDGYATGLDYATRSQAADLNRVVSTDKPYLTPEEQHHQGNALDRNGWSAPPVIAPQAAPVTSMPHPMEPLPEMPPTPGSYQPHRTNQGPQPLPEVPSMNQYSPPVVPPGSVPAGTNSWPQGPAQPFQAQPYQTQPYQALPSHGQPQPPLQPPPGYQPPPVYQAPPAQPNWGAARDNRYGPTRPVQQAGYFPAPAQGMNRAAIPMTGGFSAPNSQPSRAALYIEMTTPEANASMYSGSVQR